jgi:hypothetical protein
VRFRSGAHSLDRALVAAPGADEQARPVDVDFTDPRVLRHPGT